MPGQIASCMDLSVVILQLRWCSKNCVYSLYIFHELHRLG